MRPVSQQDYISDLANRLFPDDIEENAPVELRKLTHKDDPYALAGYLLVSEILESDDALTVIELQSNFHTIFRARWFETVSSEGLIMVQTASGEVAGGYLLDPQHNFDTDLKDLIEKLPTRL